MTASKGVRELVEAFSRWPQYRLTLVGDGELLEELRRGYGHCSNIQFSGPVAQDELVCHYREASAVILPSLAPETFGLTVIEAFACATPAIVRGAGGNVESVLESGAGFVYDDDAGLEQALRAISEDAGMRERLGRQARKAFEASYTADVHVERYLDIVASTLREKVPDARVSGEL